MKSLPETLADPAVKKVIDLILEGLPLREAIKDAGLTPQLFNYRLQGDRAAAVAYARAVEVKADLMADEVVSIADSDDDPAKVRNQMQARQWLASKLYAKRYGDRIDLNVTQTLDIGSTLAEARARLLPRRDMLDVTDAQVIDSSTNLPLKLSDKQSLNAQLKDSEPDIFS